MILSKGSTLSFCTADSELSKDKEVVELIKKVKMGDNFAFEELACKYSAIVDTSAASVLRSIEKNSLPVNRETAEDLRQDARLALYRAALTYDPEGDGKSVTFGLYAKICVRNALVSVMRRMGAAKRRADRLVNKAPSYAEGTEADNASAVLDRLRVEELLRGGLGKLSAYERRVLLCYAEGKTPSDIADELGKSAKSVSNALYRIRVKLKG